MGTRKETTSLTLDPEAKREGVAVLNRLGISLSTFVDMSLRQVALERGLPFKPSLRASSDAPLRLSDGETRRRLEELAQAVPRETDEALSALTPQDERRMLEARRG